MMTPVRCMSCGKPVAGLVEKFQQRTKAGENSNKVLNELGVTRYCCRATIMTSQETIKNVAKFRV
ncbi:MAG: DNA-directed RNA polymerase subunit N [Candidatus Aenigmarchaeota archaeon]|nr:DNA-directed RNA polymerase subunit N [Candidatus Aenigmarchaeota archaeon]